MRNLNEKQQRRFLVRDVNVRVDGSHVEGIVSPELASYTLDFWPEWKNSSIITGINLSSPQLITLARGLSPAFLRIGGSKADSIYYVAPNTTCPHNKDQRFRCLTMDRWMEILKFAEKAGARVVLCLAYSSGIHHDTTEWSHGNNGVYEFLNYTRHFAPRGVVYGFELGNEPFHTTDKTKNATKYKLAYQTLREYIYTLWKDVPLERPKIMGPAAQGSSQFHKAIVHVGEYLDIATFHIYYIGSGHDEHLAGKALTPYKYVANHNYNEISAETSQHATIKELWFGEGAMAHSSGRDGVTNTFLSSFSYVFQLGQMALVKPIPVKVLCRQTLMGGNYGLITHDNTFQPNPDYWVAYLWTKFVGTVALEVKGIDCCKTGTSHLLMSAFCAKPSEYASAGDVVVVFININTKLSYKIKLQDIEFDQYSEFSMEVTKGETTLATKKVSINQRALDMDIVTGKVPLHPTQKSKNERILAPKMSITFVVLHNVTNAPACTNDAVSKDSKEESKHDSKPAIPKDKKSTSHPTIAPTVIHSARPSAETNKPSSHSRNHPTISTSLPTITVVEESSQSPSVAVTTDEPTLQSPSPSIPETNTPSIKPSFGTDMPTILPIESSKPSAITTFSPTMMPSFSNEAVATTTHNSPLFLFLSLGLVLIAGLVCRKCFRSSFPKNSRDEYDAIPMNEMVTLSR